MQTAYAWTKEKHNEIINNDNFQINILKINKICGNIIPTEEDDGNGK